MGVKGEEYRSREMFLITNIGDGTAFGECIDDDAGEITQWYRVLVPVIEYE
jgi:hypothetical protein